MTEATASEMLQEHLNASRDANNGFAITVRKDGSYNIWQPLDARYSEKDDDFLVNIFMPKISEYLRENLKRIFGEHINDHLLNSIVELVDQREKHYAR